MTRGTTGEETKDAIRLAAIAEFGAHGYRGASLESIADDLGITRAAVLHHYGTKSALLSAVLDPLFDDVATVLDATQSADGLTTRQRRTFLTRVTDTFVLHRHLAGIVIRDISAYSEAHIAERALSLTERFTVVLTRPEPTTADRVLSAAVLGAILRPLTDPLIDGGDPAISGTLVRIASTIARQIAPLSQPAQHAA